MTRMRPQPPWMRRSLALPLAAGVVLGLLLAPKPGWATRREVLVWARELFCASEPPTDDKTY